MRNRSVSYVVVPAAAVLLILVRTVVSSDPPDVPEDWRQRIAKSELRVAVGIAGKPRALFVTQVTWNVDFPELDLLASSVGVEELEPETRRRIEREMGPYVYGESPCIDLLIFQLSYAERRQPGPDLFEPYAGIRLHCSFRVGPDGTWVPRRSGRDLQEVGIALKNILDQETVVQALRLSEAQQAVLKAIRDEYLEKKRRLGFRLNNLPPAPDEGALARNQKLFDRIAAEHRQLYADSGTLIEKTLSARQRAELSRLSHQSIVSRAGYVAALVDSPVGKKAGVTEAENGGFCRRARRFGGSSSSSR